MIGEDSFLTSEAIITVNSLIAASYPEEFGVLHILISPLYNSVPNEVQTIRYTAVGGSASIGLYNALELKREEYSKTDIFVRNMVVYNLWYGALYLLDSKYYPNESALNIMPINEGLAFNLQYSF